MWRKCNITLVIDIVGDKLTEAASRHVQTFPSVESVNWRVDVTISTTSLSRAFQPTVRTPCLIRSCSYTAADIDNWTVYELHN